MEAEFKVTQKIKEKDLELKERLSQELEGLQERFSKEQLLRKEEEQRSQERISEVLEGVIERFNKKQEQVEKQLRKELEELRLLAEGLNREREQLQERFSKELEGLEKQRTQELEELQEWFSKEREQLEKQRSKERKRRERIEQQKLLLRNEKLEKKAKLDVRALHPLHILHLKKDIAFKMLPNESIPEEFEDESKNILQKAKKSTRTKSKQQMRNEGSQAHVQQVIPSKISHLAPADALFNMGSSISALLKITSGETELFIKAKELQILIASIKDEEIKKELLLRLNLLGFLQANIAEDLPDQQIIKQMPSQAIAKLYAIISSEKFCFYFSCLFAYKKVNLNSIDEVLKDKVDEDKKIRIKNTILSFVRHADEYSLNALELKRNYETVTHNEISFILLLCCNKIKAYENIMSIQIITRGDIGVITSIYYKSLRENRFFKHHTLSDIKQLLINFESAIAQIEIRIKDYNLASTNPRFKEYIFKYLGSVMFLFSLAIEVIVFEDTYKRDNNEVPKPVAKVMSIFLLISVLIFFTPTLIAQRAKVNFRKNLNIWSSSVINYLVNKLGVPDQIHKLYNESFHFDKAMQELNSLQQSIQRDLQSIRLSVKKLGSEAIVDLNYIETLESAFLIKEVYSYIEKNIIALARVPSVENFIVPALRDTSNVTFFSNKELKKQSVLSSSTYKEESPATKLKSSNSGETISARPPIELTMSEIEQPDEDPTVRDFSINKMENVHLNVSRTISQQQPFTQLSQHSHKILTELSEPESDSVENTELHKVIINGNMRELKAILKKQQNLNSEEFKSFINEGNLDGNRLLHFAVRANHTKAIKTLIRKGADINCKNNLGERPLHKAAKLGYVSIAKLLVEAGAELDAVSYKNNTAFHYACDYLQVKMVAYLISLQANIGIENQQQVTALELLSGKQSSSEVETIKKMLNEYQASVIAEKIAQRFRVICKLNYISSLKKKATKELLETWVREECKSSTKFCEWTATQHYRVLDATIDDIAKAIDKKTQEFKKEFEKPDLIKSEVKLIVEQTISNIESKKVEAAQAIPSNTVPKKEMLVINNFKSYLWEGLYTSYIYYSLILAEIASNPNITNNQLLEILKNISPLLISGAKQIISSVTPSIPGLQTGIQQSANVVSVLTPIAINQIEAWLTKRDNKKRRDEAQCFVNAFINKNNLPISFLNRSIFRIDQEKLDDVVDTMAERFEDQLLDLQAFHAETLAQYLRDRIVKHLLDNRDQFEGESEGWIARKGNEWWKTAQEKFNSARVPPPRLALNKRCILAILMQSMGATDEQVLNVHNKEVYLHGYIVWSGIKVKKGGDRKNEYDYYGHPDEKTRLQHSLYGYCLGTIEEVERRGFKRINPNFANTNDKDKKSWKSMRDKGFFSEGVNKRNDKDEESDEELLEKSYEIKTGQEQDSDSLELPSLNELKSKLKSLKVEVKDNLSKLDEEELLDVLKDLLTEQALTEKDGQFKK